MHFKRMCILGLFGCGILQISIKSNRSIVSFRISVALLIFYLKDLSIAVSGVSQSPTIIIFLSTFLFMSVSICLICLGTPIFGEYMLMNINVTSPCISPHLLYSGLLCLSYELCHRVSFVWVTKRQTHLINQVHTQRNGTICHAPSVGRIRTIKLTILPKAIYKFNLSFKI